MIFSFFYFLNFLYATITHHHLEGGFQLCVSCCFSFTKKTPSFVLVLSPFFFLRLLLFSMSASYKKNQHSLLTHLVSTLKQSVPTLPCPPLLGLRAGTQRPWALLGSLMVLWLPGCWSCTLSSLSCCSHQGRLAKAETRSCHIPAQHPCSHHLQETIEIPSLDNQNFSEPGHQACQTLLLPTDHSFHCHLPCCSGSPHSSKFSYLLSPTWNLFWPLVLTQPSSLSETPFLPSWPYRVTVQFPWSPRSSSMPYYPQSRKG